MEVKSMDDKLYSITLADGTTFENLRLNGNNFISSVPVSAESFDNNCSPLTISDGDTQEVHEYAELVQITIYNGEYWFVIRVLSPDELRRIKMQSDIEYVAMMAGVEL